MSDTAQCRHPLTKASNRAKTISQALPYMQRYDGQSVVGQIWRSCHGETRSWASAFARDIVLLKQSGVKPVVVHGGGPQIKDHARAPWHSSPNSRVACVSPTPTLWKSLKWCLAGSINKSDRAQHQCRRRPRGRPLWQGWQHGHRRKLTRTIRDPDSKIEEIVDLGFVGDPKKVDRSVLDIVCQGCAHTGDCPRGTWR